MRHLAYQDKLVDQLKQEKQEMLMFRKRMEATLVVEICQTQGAFEKDRSFIGSF
jgi:hypothetical protein